MKNHFCHFLRIGFVNFPVKRFMQITMRLNNWEKYLKKKHPHKGEIESKDIWKKWYCYDDDWGYDEWGDWDKKWWDRWH